MKVLSEIMAFPNVFLPSSSLLNSESAAGNLKSRQMLDNATCCTTYDERHYFP